MPISLSHRSPSEISSDYMSTLTNPVASIRDKLSSSDRSRCRFLWGATGGVAIDDLLSGSSLEGRRDEMCGRSILLATRDQLAAALALLELDGVANRIVICPPEISLDQF